MGKYQKEPLPTAGVDQPQEPLTPVFGRIDQHTAELPNLRLEQRVDGPAGPTVRFGAILEVFGGIAHRAFLLPVPRRTLV